MSKITVEQLLEAMPKTIKVGTQTYSVEALPDLKSIEDGEPVNGECTPQHLSVRIEANLPSKALVVDTFLHEFLHAIWDERSLPKKPNEERAVRSLATGILQLYQDNPKLLDWIKKGLK